MDFIFMLTREDQTVTDCLDVFEQIKPVQLKHVGCKDIGVDTATLRELAKRIRASGAISYMEVVSTSPEAAINSAKVAREIGIDRLLGGTQVAEILPILKGSSTKYYPFPGKPIGHPTKLGGSPEDVKKHCEGFLSQGCAGVDLLAFRATEADPLDLIRAARKGMPRGANSNGEYLIVAGSVNSPERIREVKDAGADAFTIGSAAFDGSFSRRKGSLLSQLWDIEAACK